MRPIIKLAIMILCMLSIVCVCAACDTKQIEGSNPQNTSEVHTQIDEVQTSTASQHTTMEETTIAETTSVSEDKADIEVPAEPLVETPVERVMQAETKSTQPSLEQSSKSESQTTVTVSQPSTTSEIQQPTAQAQTVQEPTTQATQMQATQTQTQMTEKQTEEQKEPAVSHETVKPAEEPVAQPEEPHEPIGYLQYCVAKDGMLGTDYPLISGYGPRDSQHGKISSFHRGMDFLMDVGTPLIAPDDCIVSYIGDNNIRGKWAVLYWGHGYYIVYQHMSNIATTQGELLRKGELIGYSGDTGASLLPHLHLEILESYDGANSLENFEDEATRINPYYFVFGEENF